MSDSPNPLADLKAALKEAKAASSPVGTHTRRAAAWLSVSTALAAAEAERETLKDRVFILAQELGYAPDAALITAAGDALTEAEAISAVLGLRESNFKGPVPATVRQRRLAAETAGWRALNSEPSDANNTLKQAIAHAVNYHGLDAKLNNPDWQIAEMIEPEVRKHLNGETDVQIIERMTPEERAQIGMSDAS